MLAFQQVFKEATGYEPFPWQERFAGGESIPSLVSVPTGLGKTAGVILGWLWRRCLAGPASREATPRRLVYCLPMRVLVEQTRDCAREWLSKLNILAADAPLSSPVDKVAVHVLMGGDLEVDWDRWPDRDQILIGTQDMLLSRALNRGYAMSRFRWPVQFGLLNSDCLWVMDEVQLMGNGLATTAQLQAFRRGFGTIGKTVSTWMSATMRPDWLATVDFDPSKDAAGAVGIDGADKAHPMLRPRFEARKLLAKAPCHVSPDGKPEAALVLERHRPGTRTLIVVNTVKRAQALYDLLAKRKPAAELVLVHSRFRWEDRAAQMRRLLADPGDAGTIAVCTQVVEAGADVSARLLITDLAPWSSMVQRMGRCNRRGEFNEAGDAQVVWIPPLDLHDDKKLRPYAAADLRDASDRLSGLSDVGPNSLPGVEAGMAYTHVPRRKDIVELFDTTPDLAGADIDISRFIRESGDNDVQVFWRHIVADAEPAADEPGPDRRELCSVPVGDCRDWLKKKHTAWRWDHLLCQWRMVRPHEILPGLVLLLRACDGGYDSERGWTGDGVSTEPISVGAAADEANDDDALVHGRGWLSVAEHTDRVVAALDELVNTLGLAGQAWCGELAAAARWHDAGKAHPIFQEAMPQGAPDTDRTWAKSLPRMKRYERPGFRHELASALAMLASGHGDLAAYLAAAHHGKVRLSIRSLPHEQHPPGGPERRFARGLWDGDVLPAVDLGGGVVMPATSLSLSFMELGEDGATGPSWLARMLALRDAPGLGPMRLALLEAILRVADWRGSCDGVPAVNEEVP